MCPHWFHWWIQETMGCKGVRLASGQVLHSEKIIAGPTVTLDNLPLSTSSLQSSEEQTEAETLRCSASEEVCTSSEATGISVSSKVARCVCISDQSLQPGLTTILIIFPPKCKILHLNTLCCLISAHLVVSCVLRKVLSWVCKLCNIQHPMSA
jgi:hypothetical protein